MTVFEEKVRNFVLNGIPFEHTPISDITVIGTNVYGTQTIVLDTVTLICKPAFSDTWLFAYDYVDGQLYGLLFSPGLLARSIALILRQVLLL